VLELNRLHPGPSGVVAALSLYAVPDGRRHVRGNMVASVDGAATLDGRVGTLTGPADQALLLLLRSLADVLLVGAGTLRAEGYGPLTVEPGLRELRLTAGQSPAPRLAVLSRSLDVDLAGPAFTEAVEPPLLLTTELADPERVHAAGRVAEVVVAGERSVDLRRSVDVLTERGLTRVLSEGGPHVLAGLFAEDLLDELCLAVAPVVTCGEGARVTAGPQLPAPASLALAHVAERDGFLFLRYTRG
jgi:riboflavin biosynthesis pyrimidine reductase